MHVDADVTETSLLLQSMFTMFLHRVYKNKSQYFMVDKCSYAGPYLGRVLQLQLVAAIQAFRKYLTDSRSSRKLQYILCN